MKYVTPTQAAKIMNVHPETIRRRINSGDLPAFKFLGIWAIDKNDLGPTQKEIRGERSNLTAVSFPPPKN